VLFSISKIETLAVVVVFLGQQRGGRNWRANKSENPVLSLVVDNCKLVVVVDFS
jgi:hypothetical protein